MITHTAPNPFKPPLITSIMQRGCVAALVLMLAACSIPNRIPRVYDIDIQQGNVIGQYMLDRLQVGMEKSKVNLIMGTPLLTDSFNPNRWEYVHTLTPGGGEETYNRVTIIFENDRFARVEGALQPRNNREQLEDHSVQVIIVPPKPKKGFFDRY